MKQRLKKIAAYAAVFLALGLGYTGLYYLGIQIPCIFHKITGLYCPGCGISRMCISILNLDFYGAFRYNGMVMLLLPVLVILGVQLLIAYLKDGKKGLSKNQKAVVWAIAILLILFGIVRNIPQFEFLRPPV